MHVRFMPDSFLGPDDLVVFIVVTLDLEPHLQSQTAFLLLQRSSCVSPTSCCMLQFRASVYTHAHTPSVDPWTLLKRCLFCMFSLNVSSSCRNFNSSRCTPDYLFLLPLPPGLSSSLLVFTPHFPPTTSHFNKVLPVWLNVQLVSGCVMGGNKAHHSLGYFYPCLNLGFVGTALSGYWVGWVTLGFRLWQGVYKCAVTER